MLLNYLFLPKVIFTADFPNPRLEEGAALELRTGAENPVLLGPPILVFVQLLHALAIVIKFLNLQIIPSFQSSFLQG